MGGAVKPDLKARRRPGAIQTTLVILVCLALLILAAYAGYLLLAGHPLGIDIHWLEEEMRSYLD